MGLYYVHPWSEHGLIYNTRTLQSKQAVTHYSYVHVLYTDVTMQPEPDLRYGQTEQEMSQVIANIHFSAVLKAEQKERYFSHSIINQFSVWALGMKALSTDRDIELNSMHFHSATLVFFNKSNVKTSENQWLQVTVQMGSSYSYCLFTLTCMATSCFEIHVPVQNEIGSIKCYNCSYPCMGAILAVVVQIISALFLLE